MILKFTFILACRLLHVTVGYPMFQQNIPNGEIVPSPCNPNHVWQGVGHQAKGGGGPRNPFGLAFAANGYTWTTALCRADSDGDGRTDGQELGDPDCTWVKGHVPKTSHGLSHPGICEPIDSAQCQGKNAFLNCSQTEFSCADLSDPDVIKKEVRLTQTDVPAKETTYICQVLDLPTDKDYHLVAVEPYIDNINVMHHIVAYGCTDKANITADKYQPNECFMTRPEGCDDIIAMWAVGSNGLCYHPNAGFRIGKTGYQKMYMEMHWNNPMQMDSYTDGSGLILHLTPNLKPYDAGMIMIGQSHLIIPPGREKYTVNGTCSSECTQKRITDSIYIVGALNHMHYLGSSALSQMITSENKVIELARDDHYSYDSPMYYIYDEPLLMEGGSELQLFCDFKSTSRSRTTFSGQSTSDEMCYAFLMYYPKQNWNGGNCLTNGIGDSCEWESGTVNGCEFSSLANYGDPNSPGRYTDIWTSCQVGYCLEECKPIAKEVLSHPCYQYPLYYLWQSALRSPDFIEIQDRLSSFEYWSKLFSCKAELALEKCDDTDGNGWNWPISGATSSVISWALIFVMSICSILYIL